ncbi:hypothetical protein GCM10009810_05650 [Nostocoides vanveenii]|uniref:Uncharacterized protein n=1 Tax=Nostocoides vanveenii TaxID=330835 RepID=A0ABP4W8R5_9MICO
MGSRPSATSTFLPPGTALTLPQPRAVPTAERHTAESAAALTAAFIDPALDSDAPSAIWNPVALAWESGPTRI